MDLKLENNYQKHNLINENSFLMASSSETVSQTKQASSRPTMNSQINKPTIIHHFQIKKSQSFNKPIKIENSLNEKNSIEIKIQEINSLNKQSHSTKSNDSRSTVTTAKNHVQFVLPVSDSFTAAQLMSATPTNTAATASLSSINNSSFKGAEYTNAKVSNRIQSTLPLKNITTIRSSSFRNHNSIIPKYDLSNSNTVNPFSSNMPKMMQHDQKKIRSYENLNMIRVSEFKADDQNQPSIHRLIKMASNWNGSKSRSDSSASNSYFKYPKINESSLISQSKIRQTQMFLNDENKCINSCESVLSRKVSEYERSNRGHKDDDDASDKINTNRSRTPIRILPITSRNTFGTSAETVSKKSSASELNENIGNIINNNNTNIWSHSNVTNSASEISDGSASVKDSSITNYLNNRKNNKSFNLVINRNLKLHNSSTTNQLNRVSQLPIQIQ